MGQVHEHALRVARSSRRDSQGTARVGSCAMSEKVIAFLVSAQIYVCYVHVSRSDRGLQILSLSKRQTGVIASN